MSLLSLGSMGGNFDQKVGFFSIVGVGLALVLGAAVVSFWLGVRVLRRAMRDDD